MPASSPLRPQGGGETEIPDPFPGFLVEMRAGASFLLRQ
ncbi:hypothetical protein OPIT5_26135 [Opitutaceae bacterium TAV5]|nr:hypothetical protein OPIT5_26135 [Opitutaceae bacterium TAV5]